MKSVGVECRFAEDGAIQVRKVQLNGRWLAVGQGRQWIDENGRHALIMLPGDEVRELILQAGSFKWGMFEVKRRGGGTAV